MASPDNDTPSKQKTLSQPNPLPLVRRPATPVRAAANRANAAKSTGPKLSVGKQISALNRLDHGLTSAQVILPGETREQYDQFCARFIREIAPQGPAEELLVERLVACAWRLRRLGRIEAEILQFLYDQNLVGRIEQHAGRVPRPTTRLGANVHYSATHGPSFTNLHRYEAQLERSVFSALTQLRQLQQDRAKQV